MEYKNTAINYCGQQFRPQENYMIGTKREVLASASDRLKEWLGLRVWCGYGRIGNLTAHCVDTTNELIGELTLE